MPHRTLASVPWRSGRSDEGVTLWGARGSAHRAVLFGPAPGHRTLHPQLSAAAQRHLPFLLQVDPPMRVSEGHLEKLVSRTDRRIRADFSEQGADGMRATLVYASFRQGRLHVAHTGGGSVIVLRGGQLMAVAGEADASLPPMVVPSQGRQERRQVLSSLPWIGARRRSDTGEVGVEVALPDAPTRLQPGDRVLLCSAPLAELEAVGELAKAVGFGAPDEAAQALRDILRLRRGLQDVAVVVVDWPEGEGADEVSDGDPLVDDALMGALGDALSALVGATDAERACDADEGADGAFVEEDAELFSAVSSALERLAVVSHPEAETPDLC